MLNFVIVELSALFVRIYAIDLCKYRGDILREMMVQTQCFFLLLGDTCHATESVSHIILFHTFVLLLIIYLWN